MKLSLAAMRSLLTKGLRRKETGSAGLLSTEQSENIQKLLEELFEQQKPFLKHRYSLRDLSDTISVPVHQLSAFFNRVKGMHFSDFINQYRINYCISFLEKSEIKKVNLAELSGICGFNNRNTFSDAFKKFTGQTPSSFIKGLK